jgi:type II secretory pathway pseudopilin PulG
MRTKQQFAGFGLIELMVSISIMLLVMSILMTRQDSFRGATLLRGEAYEVALKVREVQSLAVSAAFTGDGDYRGALGVYFNTSDITDGSYIVFKDIDSNSFYSSGLLPDPEEYDKPGILDERFEIAAIRLMNGTAVFSTPAAVSLLFERPNFDAKIYTGANTAAAASVSGVEIDVRVRGTAGSDVGEVRTVEITKTGQISVK